MYCSGYGGRFAGDRYHLIVHNQLDVRFTKYNYLGGYAYAMKYNHKCRGSREPFGENKIQKKGEQNYGNVL